MKKALAIVGGTLGFLAGVAVYITIMLLVFDSERYSTKIGALFAIGGAIGGASLMDLITSKAGGASTGDTARVERLWKAVLSADHEAIEGFRDIIQPADIAPLAARWTADSPWETKEALIALLTDQTAKKHPVLAPIFRDGLKAPTFEVRCTSYCSLTGDFESFTEFLEGDDATLQAKLKVHGIN